MKFSKFVKKNWVTIFIYPIVIVILFFSTCGLFNFLLVPVKGTSMIEAVIQEARADTKNIDTLFVGTSRTFRAIDAYDLSKETNTNAYNLAYGNATYLTSYYLLKELYKTQHPETIYLEVSIANFVKEKGTNELYAYQTLTGDDKQQYAKEINLDYNDCELLKFTNYLNNFSNAKVWQNIAIKTFKDPITALNEDGYSTYYGKGFLYSRAKAKPNEHLSLPAEYQKFSKAVSQQCEEYFFKIIDFCQQNGIKVKLFSPPYPYSIIHDQKRLFNDFDEYLKELTAESDLDYYDFSKLKKSLLKLDNQYFYNSTHCNGAGALALLPILENLMQDVDNDTYHSENYFYPNFNAMIEDYAI